MQDQAPVSTPFMHLAERLANAGQAITAWVTQAPELGPLLARLPFAAVAYDLQHSRLDMADVMRAIPEVAAAGKPVIVRVPVDCLAWSSRLLDAGASCIIAPMIADAQQARQFVEYCKYPPTGERSWGPFQSVALSGLTRQQYLEAANRYSLAIAMIETQDALDRIDEILAVEGLDGVFLGPTDLGISLSGGQRVDDLSAVQEAMQRVVAACRKAGKIAGVYCLTDSFARTASECGFTLLALGSDKDFMIKGGLDALRGAQGDPAG